MVTVYERRVAMRRVVVVIALLTILALVMAVGAEAAKAKGGKAMAAKAGMLDGTKWSADLMSPKKGAKPMPDTLSFEKGMFDSIACHAYGFGNGRYMGKKGKAGAMSFSATTTSEKSGRMNWRGAVKGDTVSGTLVWTPKKGKAETWKFSGKKTT